MTAASLAAARAFLERTDLSALHTAVHELAGAIDRSQTGLVTEMASLASAITAHQSSLDGRIEAIEATLSQHLATARAELTLANEAKSAAEARLAAIPDKYRRKLGL